MKIYTRTGDAGETALYGGKRVAKCSPRIEAYGSIDELQAVLGVAEALLRPNLAFQGLCEELQGLQQDGFVMCAELARTETKPERNDPLLSADRTAFLEEAIDRYSEALPPLRTFIAQGGSPAGAQLHLARTVCRRAERRVAELGREENVRPEISAYLNRLSDYLFVAARFVNQSLGMSEHPLK